MLFNIIPPARRLFFVLVTLVFMCLPVGAYAMTSGGTDELLPASQIVDRSLPFLREASSGDTLTEVKVTNLTKDPTALAGGLASQANNCRFRDIKGHKSEQAIQSLYDQNVAGGRRPCYFEPDALATRAETAVMVVRAIQADTTSDVVEKPFPDVETKTWPARYLKTAKKKGIVHGYPDQQYRPSYAVNKVEALKIITRGFDTDFSKTNLSQLKNYTDVELDQWYVQYVSAGIDQGLVGPNSVLPTTKTTLRPAELLTRAEVADLVYSMIRKRINK